MSKKDIAKCPRCSEPIEMEEDVEIGDIVYCTSCDAELEVTKIYPIKLKDLEELGQEGDMSDFRDFYDEEYEAEE